jgi:glucan-binding YG repeat protein
MKTGWIHWNEKDYFCDESGAMLVNTVTPDGASVGADGAKL